MNTPQQEARERVMMAATELQRIFARQFFDEPQIPAVADELLRETGLEELIKERDDYKAMHLEALEAYKIVSVKLAAAMKCVELMRGETIAELCQCPVCQRILEAIAELKNLTKGQTK